jgi:hypothetical protein
MKTKWNGELMPGMQELPMETSVSINAGESIWFWIGYGFGLTTNLFASAGSNQSSVQQMTSTVLA